MDIKKYTTYFHDGGIIDIKHINSKQIEISMESCQLWPEWNKDNIPLSDFQTIKGKLHIVGINYISINNKITPVESFKITYDDGDILNFRIYDNKVELLVQWCNFPPKKRISEVDRILIEAEKIYWENIPDLFDPMNL